MIILESYRSRRSPSPTKSTRSRRDSIKSNRSKRSISLKSNRSPTPYRPKSKYLESSFSFTEKKIFLNFFSGASSGSDKSPSPTRSQRRSTSSFLTLKQEYLLVTELFFSDLSPIRSSRSTRSRRDSTDSRGSHRSRTSRRFDSREASPEEKEKVERTETPRFGKGWGFGDKGSDSAKSRISVRSRARSNVSQRSRLSRPRSSDSDKSGRSVRSNRSRARSSNSDRSRRR